MKIVGTDNYNREYIADFLVAENVDKYLGWQIVEYLNSDTSDTYFSLVEDNYKLYVPEY